MGSSVSRSQEHLAKRKSIGWSIGFNSGTNWTLYGVILRPLSKIRLNDVSEMFNCIELMLMALHALFLAQQQYSLMYALFLAFHALEMSVSFIFSQGNEHTELTVLLFFQNPYVIFTQILQHYHDFQSNVAISPSIVKAYIQPYSLSGRIELIICQIKK